MNRNEIKFVILCFLVWRIGLFFILAISVKLFSLQTNFLGGGEANYINNPFFWAWGNFDGQHYINIAQNGYGFGEYTFFPLYPLLIKAIGYIFGRSLFSLNFIGQLISNFAFIVSLFGFYKLLRLDFNKSTSKLALILLLLFPTSFYFAGVYTESIFFALLVWSFWFMRRKMYFWAIVSGVLISATRPVGVFIFPALLTEWFIDKSSNLKIDKKFPFGLLIPPVGLFAYMFYLKVHIGNALAFFSQQVYVGEHRSKTIILLPQIIYRYLFKIFPNLPLTYFPVVFSTSLEFFMGIFYLFLSIMLFFKSRLSYALFVFLAYITPTLLGSFSSQSRYVLILFPVYAFLANYLLKSKWRVFAFCLVSFILLVISFCLFSRGYWLS